MNKKNFLNTVRTKKMCQIFVQTKKVGKIWYEQFFFFYIFVQTKKIFSIMYIQKILSNFCTNKKGW